MNTPTEAPTAHTLSRLAPQQRLNAEVALVRGWTGLVVGYRRFNSLEETVEGYPPHRRGGARNTVPDYVGDPATWGTLMLEEGVWVEPMLDRNGSIDSWLGHYRGGTGHMTARVHSLGVSLCCAVLAKYGIPDLNSLLEGL